MNKDEKEALLAIKRPLEYASKNSFANILKTKNLDSLIPSLADRALPHLPPPVKRLMAKLRENFLGYDNLGVDKKRERLSSSLEILEQIMTGVHDRGTPSTVSPEEPAFDLATGRKAPETPVQFIKGVGPKLASLLKKRGVSTVEDALYLFPHRYDDRRSLRKIAELKTGEFQQAAGDVLLSGETQTPRSRRKIFEVVIGDGSGTLTLKWFHYNIKYMKTLYREGERLLASGEVRVFGGAREIIHPEVEHIEAGEDDMEGFRRILPVYPLTEGLGQKTVRRIMERIVDNFSGSAVDGIPESIRSRRRLIGISKAIREVHFPSTDADASLLDGKRSPAHIRLVYDEFFFLELGIAMRSRGLDIETGIKMVYGGRLKSKLLMLLPFDLTNAQKRVISDIEGDLAADHPMHRLLQGDVGCGKTVVALIAALNAVESGYQVAVMAPTEILAEQHYLNFHRYTDRLGLRIELIKGSLKANKKSGLRERIAGGDVDIIVGTHALIQEGVSFNRLGLGIIDEQHRFGVLQRARLKTMGAGGATPDILVMTATPIPRSLAMTVYGDLELSVIDELPPGRQEIETRVYHENRRQKVYNLIMGELNRGRQAYIVYPLVEESEKMELLDATRMAEEMDRIFSEFRIGLIHGRMKPEEKEEVMGAFKSGEINILVSTTVIEVGIDVPNATVMVIEHAERFGLSQLHQLRGRVGRGSEKSRCILLAQYRKSDESRERLRVMEESSSGFDISEADLRLRGPGDFLGTRQSGMPDFRIGNILKDERILRDAREDAFGLVEKDPEMNLSEHSMTREVLRERWKGRLEFAGVG